MVGREDLKLRRFAGMSKRESPEPRHARFSRDEEYKKAAPAVAAFIVPGAEAPALAPLFPRWQRQEHRHVSYGSLHHGP